MTRVLLSSGMGTFFTLIIFGLFLWPCNKLYAQARHIAWPVYVNSQPVPVKGEAVNQPRQLTAIQEDTLYFTSPDSLHTYSQSISGSTTTGVFFTLPDSLFPVRILGFVVNMYGGNSQVGSELAQASIRAILWTNAKVPTDIQPVNQIRDTFSQTISVSLNQYMPITFAFSDTSMIMDSTSFAVGLQYSGVSDSVDAVSPIFGNPPATYNDFFIDSTTTATDTVANYYDHQSYWKNPDQVGNISGWLLLEHDPNWVPTAIDQQNEKPSDLSLLTNYPNPFNPTTQLTFVSREDGRAVLEIFDILGRMVYKENHQVRSGQMYHWRWVATEYHSGIYIARVRVNNHMFMRKMMLLK